MEVTLAESPGPGGGVEGQQRSPERRQTGAEWRQRVKGEGGDRGSSLESPPHLPASLLPLQHADQIYFKPRGPCLVGLPVSRDDVHVLHDADSDLTPVLPPHLCDGVEASYGCHRCHL